MMTIKNFKMVAEIISKIENKKEREKQAKFNADVFKQDNPRFDYIRFYAACGVRGNL
jgi:hypothetical protein